MGSACPCQVFTEDDTRFQALATFIEQNRKKNGSLLSILQEAQSLFGYLPLEVHKFIAEKSGIPVTEIYGVSTFYSQFTTVPKGKHKIQVCMGTACYVKGAQKVLEKVTSILNTKVGETTEDRLFTIEATRCLGCCGLAPVMMIDEDVYANLVNINEIPDILEKYRQKEETHDENEA